MHVRLASFCSSSESEVIFSDTALLEVEDGCAYLRFRVADMFLGWGSRSQARPSHHRQMRIRDTENALDAFKVLAAIVSGDDVPRSNLENGMSGLGRYGAGGVATARPCGQVGLAFRA